MLEKEHPEYEEWLDDSDGTKGWESDTEPVLKKKTDQKLLELAH